MKKNWAALPLHKALLTKPPTHYSQAIKRGGKERMRTNGGRLIYMT